MIDCPVNVSVYASDGSHIITLTDGVECDVSNRFGRFAVVYRPYTGEYAKVICLKERENYQFRMEATEAGLVTFELSSDADADAMIYSFNHVEINTGSVIKTSVEQATEQKTYDLDLDGDRIFENSGNIFASNTSENVPVQKITLDETEVELYVGENAILNYILDPLQATYQEVVWISTNPDVVTVSNGRITAIQEGTAVIYCIPQDNILLSVSCKIIVLSTLQHQHITTLVPFTAANCSNTGVLLHWHCSICGKDFADSTGTVELTDIMIPIDPTNHMGGIEIRDAVEPTYESDGYTGDTYCLGCGVKIISGTIIPKKDIDTELTLIQPVYPASLEYEWVELSMGTRLYFDGKMITGWYQDRETAKWYWLDQYTGFRAENEWVKIDNVWYLFDRNGVMLTGWQKVAGKWYYLKPWGGMAVGWQLIDGIWYFLRSNGSMAFNAWIQSSDQWYYLTGNGSMATARWVEWKGNWYFLYSSGVMATDTTIDGYYINASGAWIK